MNDKEMILAMYNKYSEQIPAQFSRRQTDNRYFLGICLAIFAGIAWMIENCFLITQPYSVQAACVLGIIICFSWASTLYLYNKSINSKCTILRIMENDGLLYSLYQLDKEKIYEKKGELKKPNPCLRCTLKKIRHYLPIFVFIVCYGIAFFWFLPK